MTMQANGSASCDRCGADVGNGSVAEAVVLSTLGDDGLVRNLHLGLAHRCGCARRVLTRKALAHYVEAVDEPGKPLPLFAGPADSSPAGQLPGNADDQPVGPPAGAPVTAEEARQQREAQA